jgi:hypothetical protein
LRISRERNLHLKTVSCRPRGLLGWNARTVNHTTAIFRQVNKHNPYTHHDALEFPDGQVALLTDLFEGQEATVLQLPAQPVTAAEITAQPLDDIQVPRLRVSFGERSYSVVMDTGSTVSCERDARPRSKPAKPLVASSPIAIRASFMISWSKNSKHFPKDIFLTRTGRKFRSYRRAAGKGAQKGSCGARGLK